MPAPKSNIHRVIQESARDRPGFFLIVNPSDNERILLKDIPGFPGYRAGDDGSIWSCLSKYAPVPGESRLIHRWHRLVLRLNTHGRPYVSLRRNGKTFTRLIHRIVLETFIGPRPEGMEACHFPDRDITNNRISNLRWDTREANYLDKVVHGTRCLGEAHPNAKLAEHDVRQIFKDHAAGMSTRKIANRFSVSQPTIRRILRGLSWGHVPRNEQTDKGHGAVDESVKTTVPGGGYLQRYLFEGDLDAESLF